MALSHYPSLHVGDLTYLRGLAFTVKWTPVFFNQTQKTQTGASIDIGLASTPLHQFELTYELLADFPSSGSYVAANYEFRRLLGFYTAMSGSLGRFVFSNPDDFQVTGQSLGQGTGSKTTFTIVRDLGDASASMFATEPIGLLDDTASAPVVKVGGVTKTAGSDYTITQLPANSSIVFASAPASGADVTIDMQYCYYCQFVEDSLLVEKFSGNRWQAVSVKLQSCRPSA